MTTAPSTLAAASGASELAAPDLAARNRLVISLLLVSAFVVILNETIMSVAIPHLMTDLGVTASAAQWLTTAFLLTMAVVIPMTGFLLQQFNTRPVFIAAMSLFSAGTLLSALAPGLEVLVAGRIVQASGTAIMMPLLMTTVMNLVPPETRGRTMGYISIVISVAPAIGPTISGIILSLLDWRWMFILVLPIAIGALVLGALRIVNVTTPRRTPLDLLSVLLSAIGFGGIVYGLSSIGEGAGEPHVAESAAAALSPAMTAGIGVVALALFVWRQLALQRSDRALLDLRTFRFPIFTLAASVMAVSMMALFGTIILLPIYMQTVLGIDALQTGLLLLPGGLAMGLLAPLVGRLYDRYGPTPLIVPGSALVSVALWSMTAMAAGGYGSVALLLAVHVVLSIGLALMFTPLFSAGLGALPRPLYSHGSAITGTTQQLAGAAGIALFVSVMTIEAAGLTAAGAGEIEALAGGIADALRYGAMISMAAIPAAAFIRRPPDDPGAAR